MKRLLRLLLPVCAIAIFFASLYLVTKPKGQLPDYPEVNSALRTLEDYGYESQQIVGTDNYWHLGLCFVGFVISILIYLCVYHLTEKKQMAKVIDYVHNINNKVYDLKLDENHEGELSLLTNELYKTTVLLQETAKTDRKRAKNLETALADISHQLRTPLTSLQITLDNLYDNPNLDKTTRQTFLKTASRQLEQMSELVITLLNLAKLDSGTLKLHSQEILLADLLNEVVDRLAILAEINNIHITQTGALQTKIKVDPKWQTQALANIVKNCIEHSQSGQTVNIAVENNVIYTRITITDSGDGIEPEDLRHIFERFYKTKNTHAESIGIGLAFAKTVIEADAGQIKAKSRPGCGTTFEVTYYHSSTP